MKNVLLFIAVVVLLGSLKMPDKVRCPDTVIVVLYRNGKEVGRSTATYFKYQNPILATTPDGRERLCDSVAYRIEFRPNQNSK